MFNTSRNCVSRSSVEDIRVCPRKAVILDFFLLKKRNTLVQQSLTINLKRSLVFFYQDNSTTTERTLNLFILIRSLIFVLLAPLSIEIEKIVLSFNPVKAPSLEPAERAVLRKPKRHQKNLNLKTNFFGKMAWASCAKNHFFFPISQQLGRNGVLPGNHGFFSSSFVGKSPSLVLENGSDPRGFEKDFSCHSHLGPIWIPPLFSFPSTPFPQNEKEEEVPVIKARQLAIHQA